MMRRYFIRLMILLIIIMAFPVNVMAEIIKEKDIGTAADAYIEERAGSTAGLAMAVFRKDDVLYSRYYGMTNFEDGINVSKDSVFEWGSVTKVLTWISVMQLKEQGKLSLDRDIREYLPEDIKISLRYEKPVTLKHLMNHKAGFQEILYNAEFRENEKIPELKDLIIMTQPAQVYEPGTVTAYSNWGAALAGLIVENVSGVPFYQYVRENIFTPLGMDHTSLKPDWSDVPYVRDKRSKNRSYSYFSDSKESLGSSIVHIGLYPAGSCAGTFPDFLKFVMQFVSNGQELFRYDSTMSEFLMATSYFDERDKSRNHHGLWVLDTSTRLLGHGGNTEGYSSSFWFDPISGTGFAVMTNEVGETTYNYGLSELIFGKPEGAPVGSNDIRGIYYNKRTIEKGVGRIAKYMYGILPVLSESKPGIFNLSGDMRLIHEGKGIYLQDNGNGLSFRIYSAGDGKVLQSYTSDYMKLSIAETAIVVFLLTGMISGAFFTLIQIILLVISLFRKKNMDTLSYFSYVSLILSMILSGIFTYLWIFIERYERTTVILLSSIQIVLILFLITNITLQVYNAVRRKNEKMNLVRTAVSAIPLAASVFFQSFIFWA